MKTLLTSLLLTGAIMSSSAVTSINLTNNFAYGENVGWMDWRGNVTSGSVIGEYFCSGYIYAANLGWIRLGTGAPTNGVQYQNLAASDYGVNLDASGNLRGYAYGANIGWINFESLGDPQVDLNTGNLTGYAYSANCGWISLSNEFAFVQTDTIPGGPDADGDGMADAWERLNFGGLGATSSTDADGDGASNQQEYLAGTNPNNTTDVLRITDQAFANGGTTVTLQWNSVATRNYRLQKTTTLPATIWSDSGLGLVPPAGAATAATFTDTFAPARYYRVQAIRPLSP
jgi:Bacterial TSP3 repeat